jgi:hypothetical protein
MSPAVPLSLLSNKKTNPESEATVFTTPRRIRFGIKWDFSGGGGDQLLPMLSALAGGPGERIATTPRGAPSKLHLGGFLFIGRGMS